MNNRPVWQTICLLQITFFLLSFNKLSAQSEGNYWNFNNPSHETRPVTIVPLEKKMLWGITKSMFQYAQGFGIGFSEYVLDTLSCIKQLIMHPVASLSELLYATYHYDETYRLARNCIVDILHQYPTYKAPQRARIHAMVLTELSWWFLPLNLSAGNLWQKSHLATWTGNMVDVVAPNLERTADIVRSIFPYEVSLNVDTWMNQNLIAAAEWFASEGAPNQS